MLLFPFGPIVALASCSGTTQLDAPDPAILPEPPAVEQALSPLPDPVNLDKLPGKPTIPVVAPEEDGAEALVITEQPAPGGRTTTDIGGEIRVTWDSQRVDLANQRIYFEGNVVATYGDTVLRADALTLELDNRFGSARGDVEVTDPMGSLTADQFNFNWADRTGSAANARISAPYLNVNAGLIVAAPDRWYLTDLEAYTADGSTRLAGVRARSAVVTPGQDARLRNVSFYLLGGRVLSLPEYTVSMDPRSSGVEIPWPVYRPGVGLGVRWKSEFLLGGRFSFRPSMNFFPGRYPSYSAQLTYSFIPDERWVIPSAPMDELTERFANGWMNSILVRSPGAEDVYVGAERASITLASTWNQEVTGAALRPSVDKPVEVIVEFGGTKNYVAGMSQTRFQNIRVRGDRHTDRVTSQLTFVPQYSIPISDNFFLRPRIDIGSFLSSTNQFGWGRFETGVLYEPTDEIRLGVAYIDTFTVGRPYFFFDEPYSQRALHARLDLNFKSTKIGVLYKYDFGSRGLYGWEFSIRQAAGALEPFITLRTFPYELSIGVRLRVEDTLRQLRARRPNLMERPTRPVPAEPAGPSPESGEPASIDP
ncbi:MAG: LptA/OstA family protein [Fimbriimonadaceae bacterium]